MAWMGKPNARQRTRLSRESRRRPHPLPKKVDDPRGIPREVIRGLADLRIAKADRETYSQKLSELLRNMERNGD